jgi:predicted DNA-binding transcriptional regulator AlpA
MDALNVTQMPTEITSLSPSQLARRLGVSIGTIYRWNQTPGTGPKFFKTGVTLRSGVRYKLAEVEAWENSRTVEPTDLNESVEDAYERHAAR